MTEVTDERLRDLVIEADDQEFLEGKAPKARSLGVVSKVMNKLGYKGFVLAGDGTPPIVERIWGVHSALYRPSDLAIGGVHGGIFMFRDVFARVHVPLLYGRAGIDPFKQTDLTPSQLEWLARRPDDLNMFIDQFTDIFDFGGGIGNYANYKTPPKEAMNFFVLAAFQLQGAAAALSVAFDFRGAVQSALIGAELALKGGLAGFGESEQAIRAHSHNLKSAALALKSKAPAFDLDRVQRALAKMPPYVENRYSPQQPSRIETGHIVMGAQYVAGEVMRQVTGYSIRQAAMQPSDRTYP